jgi:ABC-type antimicrobial peptide transport system permease subunit
VMAHSVGQRTQEMGLRMALGATARNLLRLVFVTGMRQVAIGLAIGALASLAMMRVLKSALVAVSPADPATFVIATAMLVLAAALGCYIPARRAMRVDPLVALRHE